MMRKKITIELTLRERELLEAIVASPTTAQNDRLKAQVLLLTDVGSLGPKMPCGDIAAKLYISERTVKRVRASYAARRSVQEVLQGPAKNGSCAVQNDARDRELKKTRSRRRYHEDCVLEIPGIELQDAKYRVVLSNEERTFLECITKTGKHSPRKINRAKILLLVDEGEFGPALSDDEVVEEVGISKPTVHRVRKLLVGLGSVEEVLRFNHHKAGRQPKLHGEVEATLIATTCSAPPEGRTSWTLRLLADRLVELKVVESISHVAVGNSLKKRNSSLGNEENG